MTRFLSDLPVKSGKFFKGLARDKYLYIMVLPVAAYYIIFKYVPMYGILMAFKDFNISKGILGSPWLDYYGFENFIKFFNSIYFFRLLRNTILLNVYGLLWGFPAPILFALLLNELRVGFFKRFVQTVSYLPHFLSTMVVIGLMFFLLSPNNGIVNQVIAKLGHEKIFFMGESRWFRTLYVASDVWQGFGWGAIIYIATITSIDPQLYEAAYIDGAKRLQRMWHITLPSLLPTIQMILIFSIGSMMYSGVEKVLAMYDASMYDVADVIGTYVYRRGIVNSDYSFGVAVSLFNSVTNFILLIFANWVSRKVNDHGVI